MTSTIAFASVVEAGQRSSARTFLVAGTAVVVMIGETTCPIVGAFLFSCAAPVFWAVATAPVPDGCEVYRLYIVCERNSTPTHDG